MSSPPRLIEQQLPRIIHIGVNAASEVGKWAEIRGFKTTLVITTPSTQAMVTKLGLPGAVEIYPEIAAEPDLSRMAHLLGVVSQCPPDLIVGLGGGSALDAAKVAAVLAGTSLGIADVVGSNRVAVRTCALAQVPTTAGTGSEVGMRALVADKDTSTKLMIQSTPMLADLVAVDPELMVSLPAAVTASTGIDALAHCVEAYTSRIAHPAIDLYALEGIRLIGRWLPRAVADGRDLEARSFLGTASLYGGLCLGPVNTTAGHAVAYPLGTRHGLAHGWANAIIFPHVLAFNAVQVPEKTADIVEALGATRSADPSQVFAAAYNFCRKLGVEMRLSAAGVPAADFAAMATAAHGIRRLLDNNPRAMEISDIEQIYLDANKSYGSAFHEENIKAK